MNISDLISGFKAVVADVTAGNILQAFKDSIPLQQSIIEGIEGLVGGLKFAPAPEQLAELQAAHDELKVACETAAKKKAAPGDPVGKLGDGKLLASLLALLQMILPLIAPFLKPTPAPA